MIQIKKLLRDPKRTLFEILQQVPPEQLDEAVAMLREVYRKHCAGALADGAQTGNA